MTSAHPHGFHVSPHEIATQAAALAAIGDQTATLAASASWLAGRLPMLGTAPPALHLAARLREAAGQSGLAGEINGADTELNGFHRALGTAIANYLHGEAHIASTFHAIDEAQP